MRKPAVWLGALFVAIFLGFLFYSTLRGGRYRCEVCMSFQVRSDCRTAAADTREHAVRTAVENACAQLASGVVDSSNCTQTAPVSVRWLE
jgi:hypothetical protein